MSLHFSSITDPYVKNGKRMHYAGSRVGERAGAVQFVAIDGEGVTESNGHHYVLLGVGDSQISDPDGLHWSDVFDHIYGAYSPRHAYVGFYLAYDFTQWLRSFPEERARRLLTIDGKESRRSRSEKMKGKFLPVDIDGWQIDMVGHKRMQIRPRNCQCETVKCDHKKNPWLYVCDAGGFFQTSFLNVIDPANWHDPILSPDEYATILRGKEHRPDARLDQDMRRYNVLENVVFQRVMDDLNASLRKLNVYLSAQKWYGPGQAAQAWMDTQKSVPTRKDIEKSVPPDFTEAARKSYFGGWFEIMAHGIIPGTVYEYDINSAYPDAISKLPCLMHGGYRRGVGRLPKLAPGDIALVHAQVWTRPPGSDKAADYIGAMLHRDAHARISRPVVTSGWYWVSELDAATRAGCVSRGWRSRVSEWMIYSPCGCVPPLRNVRSLYQLRQDVGKKSSLGKAGKLIMNSIYGKNAQSIGMPKYGNPIYASLITSACRTMILDAIASHPNGKSDVVMVATDAVFFLTPHPGLSISGELGEWDETKRERLALFKPGVYWDDATRQAIADDESPVFKARGVSAKEFSGQIARIDSIFESWSPDNFPGIDPYTDASQLWPKVKFPTNFAMVSALQALMRNRWDTAGTVETGKELVQNAYPGDKRERMYADTKRYGRTLYRSNPLYAGSNAHYRHVNNYTEWENITETYESVPYEKRFGMEDPFSDEYTQSLGIVPDDSQPLRSVFRLLTGQE